HDTDRQETDAELWRAELGTPPYQKSVLGGVPVFFLNSGHGGMMDPVQVQWFNNEAASIPTNQEVLIVCHYPSFCLFATYAGLKRTVATAFAGHQAPVWIISGHNHYFREDFYHNKGTRFIQSQVTSASTKIWNDGNAPGYALLGLQDGRVVSRIFRSIRVGSFQVLPSLASLSFNQLRWAFDRIEYPGEVFHEGFYDRTGRVLSFQAVDMKCHFSHVQNLTWQMNLWRFGGKVREFLISGTMALPTRVAFSATSPNGPWLEVPIPTDAASASDMVYRFLIPAQFLTATILYVNVASDLQWGLARTEIAGWGVAASAESLTGYERWIARRYKTFLLTAETHPSAIPAGSSVSNLELFAFNLAPGTGSNGAAIPPPQIQGLPSQSAVLMDQTNRFQFARRKTSTHPGIACIVEESTDLKNWSSVDPARLTVTSLDSAWEEVRMTEAVANGYFRVRVEKAADPEGGFLPWQNSVAIPAGSSADRNANSIDDLMEYGFNLTPSGGGGRPYDPSRIGDPLGLPAIGACGRLVSRIVYARMRANTAPGVYYILEQSQNQSDWAQVPQAIVTERILKSDASWEQVECLLDDASQPGMYYRVRVELSQPLLQ
ncbi:MAG: hypothetical protein RLZZ214_3477, partial [Verrucomicrobiota bacterium]